MKGFKKLALVAAIAAPLTSVHALEAIDDSMLSDMTGQSGVTIDLETQVTIGQVKWTDEGSVNLNSISVGGFETQLTADNAYALSVNKAEQTIRNLTYQGAIAAGQSEEDARAAAAAADVTGAEAAVWAQLGGAADEAAAKATLNAMIGATGVVDTNTKLDNIRLVIDSNTSGDLEILVVTQSGFNADGSINPTGVAVPVDLGVDVGSVELEAQGANGGAVIASNINLDILLGPQKFVVHNDTSTYESGLITAQGYFQLADSSSLDLDVAGVSVKNLKVGNFLGDNALTGQAGAVDFTNSFATSDLNDYTQVGFAYYEVNIGANAADQLVMDVANFNADIQMDVEMGGASIGQITMTDFDVSGTKLTVYGH
ncbi:DUF6160 family protein [Litoribrevibacter euphylliae]|uniref:DUF6160 family protein n=1 Tax=Litoribrevibacter euphylliae TaxID=1834034 RepID=A0ABV7HA92_9GAMM